VNGELVPHDLRKQLQHVREAGKKFTVFLIGQRESSLKKEIGAGYFSSHVKAFLERLTRESTGVGKDRRV